uniref:VPS33B late endosome and lysosome associated n=2 Tax=Sus scrofa TaxID=9823 RepID=A0A8D0PGF5_PIG
MTQRRTLTPYWMRRQQMTRFCLSWRETQVTGAMAFPHRPDAPELPDFSMLKRLARDQLIYLLEQLPGKKDLFIEADLMSPLDRIANVSILKVPAPSPQWTRVPLSLISSFACDEQYQLLKRDYRLNIG